jgi:hypothetical protein
MPSAAVRMLEQDVAEISRHINRAAATAAAADDSPGIRRVRLADDTISIQILPSAAFGATLARVSLTLAERSRYPACEAGGAMLFVEDGDELLAEVVGEVAASLGSNVRLHRVLRKLCEALMVDADLPSASASGTESAGGDSEGCAAAAAAGGGGEDEGEGEDEDEDEDGGSDDSVEEEDDDDGYDDMVAEVDNWEGLQHLKRRWEAREEERRSSKRAAVQIPGSKVPRPSGLPAGAAKSSKPHAAAAAAAQQQQSNTLFSTHESFRIISNELFETARKAAEQGTDATVSAEAVNDDVHHWRVKLLKRGFTGEVAQDLEALGRQHGYDHVEVDFRFTPDLHPFYPPQVSTLSSPVQPSLPSASVTALCVGAPRRSRSCARGLRAGSWVP